MPATGGVTLFEFPGYKHVAAGKETVAEVRAARSATYLMSGSGLAQDTAAWANELDDLLRAVSGSCRFMAMDVADPYMVEALRSLGIIVANGTRFMEHTRWIKNDVEVQAIQEAVDACEIGMKRMQDATHEGVTENALFSILQQTYIALSGEWIESRLLASGPKTKPWFQECSHRKLERGDLVSFDTDLIGLNGYCADISRSWLCGDGFPTADQRFIYTIAYEQVGHNIELMQVGAVFREIAPKGYKVPERCAGTCYSIIVHGAGMCDEGPIIRHPWDVGDASYDGAALEAGMVMCVEALVAIDDGFEAVKLEQTVLVTDDGPRPLSH